MVKNSPIDINYDLFLKKPSVLFTIHVYFVILPKVLNFRISLNTKLC